MRVLMRILCVCSYVFYVCPHAYSFVSSYVLYVCAHTHSMCVLVCIIYLSSACWAGVGGGYNVCALQLAAMCVRESTYVCS